MHAKTTSTYKKALCLVIFGLEEIVPQKHMRPLLRDYVDPHYYSSIGSLTPGEPERAAKAREARRSGEFCKLNFVHFLSQLP